MATTPIITTASATSSTTNKGRTAIKIGLAIGLPLMSGIALYWVLYIRVKNGVTLAEKWKLPFAPNSNEQTQTPSTQGSVKNVPQRNISTPTSTNTSSSVFPIGIGSTGQKVKDIQNYVNAVNPLGLPAKLVVDGKFGSLTAQGVIATGYSVPVTEDEYNRMTAVYTPPPTPKTSEAQPIQGYVTAVV